MRNAAVKLQRNPGCQKWRPELVRSAGTMPQRFPLHPDEKSPVREEVHRALDK
jgi:hypothetical protein